MNRETYLNEATALLAPLFSAHGAKLPAKLRISCGFPGGGSKNSRIGECWYGEASADGSVEVFISPIVSKSADVLAILVHELVHAALGAGHGHGPVFRKLATAVGLVGKMKSTTAGPALAEKLAALVAKLGEYPHATLDGAKSETKKQSTRLVKCECGACGYTVRTTAKWLAFGAPLCPCNGEAMEVAA